MLISVHFTAARSFECSAVYLLSWQFFLVKMLSAALPVLLTFLFGLTESKQKDFYTFKVVNSRGKLVSLEKYRGSVSPARIKNSELQQQLPL